MNIFQNIMDNEKRHYLVVKNLSCKFLTMVQDLLMGIMKSDSHYVMILSDFQITDYKLRRGLNICKQKCQGAINSRMTIRSLWRNWCQKDMQQNQRQQLKLEDADICLTKKSITEPNLARSVIAAWSWFG